MVQFIQNIQNGFHVLAYFQQHFVTTVYVRFVHFYWLCARFFKDQTRLKFAGLYKYGTLNLTFLNLVM